LRVGDVQVPSTGFVAELQKLSPSKTAVPKCTWVGNRLHYGFSISSRSFFATKAFSVSIFLRSASEYLRRPAMHTVFAVRPKQSAIAFRPWGHISIAATIA